MTEHPEKSPECCPEFNPAPWDDKIIVWENKRFIKDRVCTLFYMPLNFGGVMRRTHDKVTKAGSAVQDWMCLSDHTSRWNMDVYLAVDQEIPNAENVMLSGKFFSKVFEGPFSDTDKWCKEYKELAKARNLIIKKWYMWYTTCPKCAKKYGKNYTVIMAQVE